MIDRTPAASDHGVNCKQVVEDLADVVGEHLIFRKQREDLFCRCRIGGQPFDAYSAPGIAGDARGQSVAVRLTDKAVGNFDFAADCIHNRT